MTRSPSDPMRIAYLCLQATTEGQASHAHVHEIINGLVAAGHTVDLHEPRYAGRSAPRALGRFLEFARLQTRLIRNLKSYDVLYVRSHPLAWPASVAARWMGVSTIQECNGPYEDFVQAWPAAWPVAGLLEVLARAQYRRAEAVIAVTPQLGDWIAEDTGQQHVHVVRNGANVRIFTPGEPKPDGLPEKYAVFFGALQPWQGVPSILSAVTCDEWPDDLPVVFVGDGLLADDVKAAAEKHPYRVINLGRLPYRQVPPVVSNAALSIITLDTEQRTASGTSPLKLYESMACGVPVVAGDLPGQSEVIRHARCGLLVSPVTPANLATAVAEIVSDPTAAREMGERGRSAAVAEHSWDARARQVDSVIRDVIERSNRVREGRPRPVSGIPNIAYLSLQAVVDGQDTWAAVTEIIKGLEADGWNVDRYFPNYKGGVAPGPWGRLVEMTRIQRRLSRHLGEYDALYVRAHPAAWPISTLARRKGIPVVQECNGPYEDLFIAWPSTRTARPFFQQLQRSQYRGASAIISVAKGLTEWLIDDTGNHKVITNGNGANVAAFTPDAPRKERLPERFAVFFGQFPAWQGIQTLLKAVHSPEWPSDFKLVFVGDGALRPSIEAAVAELPDRVMYIGRLPYEEVAQVAAHAVVSYVPMVAPEREAKFSPLKLYESMACGVPVIASDTVGISEVVSEWDCGILVPPGDSEAIVSATRELLADPARARAMGERGRSAAVECYSWRARSIQRRHVIEEAIGNLAEGAMPVAEQIS